MKQRQEPQRHRQSQRQRHRDIEAETEIFGGFFCVCVWGEGGGVGRRRVAVLCRVVVLGGRDGAGRE